MRPHVTIKRPQVGKLLLSCAGHLVEQRALHVHHFVMRKRKNKVFTPRVEQTKRQRVVITSTKEWIGLEILQSVVHPTHVPLEIEAKAAGVNRAADCRP